MIESRNFKDSMPHKLVWTMRLRDNDKIYQMSSSLTGEVFLGRDLNRHVGKLQKYV